MDLFTIASSACSHLHPEVQRLLIFQFENLRSKRDDGLYMIEDMLMLFQMPAKEGDWSVLAGFTPILALRYSKDFPLFW